MEFSQRIEEEQYSDDPHLLNQSLPYTCSKGHRSSLSLQTQSNGRICLICLASLLSDSQSFSHHLSFALSQLSLALRCDRSTPNSFVASLCTCHPHLLVGPLSRALESACERGDDALSKQVGEVIVQLVNALNGSVVDDFVSRIWEMLCAAGSLVRHIYTLHCFGILLSSHHNSISTTSIKDKYALFSKLLEGLHLPSEEIRGEILFVLYRLSIIQATPWDDDFMWQNSVANLSTIGSILLRNSLDVLLKAQSDDVRLNCIAFLLVLTKTGVFENLLEQDKKCINSREEQYSSDSANEIAPPVPLITLFSDSVKGSLLSSNPEVQIGTLDLISHFLSCDGSCIDQIQAFIEENIADYVFEALRLSGKKDALLISCIQVLSLLSLAEESFKQKLAIGFQIILSSLNYVSEIPYHPVQPQVLKLVLICLKDCTGKMPLYQIEDISQTLTLIFKNHNSGELGTHLETFILACLIYVEILKYDSARDVKKFPSLIYEALENAISSILLNNGNPNTPLVLHSLYFLKEALVFSHERENETLENPEKRELETNIVKLCDIYLFPFLERLSSIDMDNEDILLSILEIFHAILLNGSENVSNGFANFLASSSWFGISFTFLGIFNGDALRSMLYFIHGSIVDRVLGVEFGDKIREVYTYLPSDPLEMIYLLGQKSLHDLNLASCQHAVIVMLYCGSLYGESFADETQILSSLEQYILINSNNFTCNRTDSMILTQLILLYSYTRNSLSTYQAPLSSEAENTIFHLITYKEWDLLSIRVDPFSLKWLFQHEEIAEPLLNQLLNFCRSYSNSNNLACMNMDGDGGRVVMDIKTIAELAVSEGNCVISVLVTLLGRVGEGDIMYVMSVITEILRVFPEISDRFCLCGIIGSLNCVLGDIDTCSWDIFLSCSYMVFDILYYANYNALIYEEWFTLASKLLNKLENMRDSDQFTEQGNIILGILCLILHQSTNRVLEEAAKSILLNGCLISLMDRVVKEACSKGPALSEHGEETPLGKSLIFVLLLCFFSLKSLNAILKVNIDWQDSFQGTTDSPSLSVLGISCHDLCKILRTGSSGTKLISSQCLFELFDQISHQISQSKEDLKCSPKYLQSIISVIEGFVFHENGVVSKNCGFILAKILSWESVGLKEKKILRGFSNKWCRLIVEEFIFGLSTASGLASKEFTYQQNGLVGIVISLLKWETVPLWLEKLLVNSVISGILSQISARNITGEIVRLFRVLMEKKFLNQDHVHTLQHLFQICRRQLYEESVKDQFHEEENGKEVPDKSNNLWTRLMYLMLNQNHDYCDGAKKKNKFLLDEMELFFQESGNQQ